ncbi:unnamed protein product [Larinioides sclopetarius]|uniref:Phospholipase A2-like central domain-containing protein n=1 Tax=Larinioides sclopetarius TaxID=280406 RepID=A0AAV2BQR4_9ARAC
MRFIVVLSTVFFVFCCFSVLNVVFSDRNRQNSDIFYQTEKALLNNKLTDEKISRCQNFSDKIIKEFNQKLTEEELQNYLSRCRVFLQQNSKRFGSKDKNDTTRLPPFENYKSQEHYYYTEQHLTAENSKQVNGKNTGSSDKSHSVPVTKLDEGNLIEKPTDKPENQKTESDNAILNSKNTNWSLWNYLLGGKDPRKSSNENRAFENFERNPTTESSINLENPIDLEYFTTEIAPLWKIIMPGTKWCGAGNIAVNDDDLGYFEDVDRCCRAHDKCNDIIPPGGSK